MRLQNKPIHKISSESDNGKVVKFRGKSVTDWRMTEVTKPLYTQKWPYLRPRTFFSKRNFDTRFRISSVGIPEISPYTKSKQPRITGKHLTRLAKNGNSVTLIYSNTLQLKRLLEGWRPLSRSLDILFSHWIYKKLQHIQENLSWF